MLPRPSTLAPWLGLFALAGAFQETEAVSHVVHRVALSPDGRAAAFGRVTSMGSGGRLILRTGDGTSTELHSLAIVRALAFSPDGESVFASQDRGAVLQVGRDGRLVRTFELGRLPGFVRDVAVSVDGRLLAAVDDEDRVQCFRVGNAERRWSASSEHGPLACTFLPDGRLAVGDKGGGVTLWSRDGEPGERHRLLDGLAMHVAVDATGRRIAAASWNGAVAVQDLEDGAVRRRPPTGRRIYALALNPAGEQLAWAPEGGGVRVWEPDTGDDLLELETERTIGALRFSDGRLVAADYRGALHRFELAED